VIERVNGEGNRVRAVWILVNDPNFDCLLKEGGIPIFFLHESCPIMREDAINPKSRLNEAARDNWSKDISAGHSHNVAKIDELDFHIVSGHIKNAAAIKLSVLRPFHDSNATDGIPNVPESKKSLINLE